MSFCQLRKENDGCICNVCGRKLKGDCSVKATCWPTVTRSHPSGPVKAVQRVVIVGPGTELKKLLAKFSLKAKGGCQCDARAAEMDRRGCDWCRENLETIVGWLKEEAARRGLPFIETAAKLLVKLAIHKARKREKK